MLILYVKNIINCTIRNIILKHKSSSLFIDSTNIANFSVYLNFWYNIKIKNKKSLKISALVDHNKVPYILDISKGSVHDAKIMEQLKIFLFWTINLICFSILN